MKAVVIHAPKDLRIDDVGEDPLGPKKVRIKIGAGGICGSDLHYYHHGGFGDVRLQEPMILGHEIAGTVAQCGTEVGGLALDDLVTINPSRPCGVCAFCQRGLQNHCVDMRFYGSAMRTPHVQGGFREFLVCDQAQAVKLPDHIGLDEAAFAEPLSVALHAVSRAGSLVGRRVLVTGSGPIGVLLTAAARRAGAREIVVTDILDQPLAFAAAIGADRVVNVAADPGWAAPFERDKGYFQVLFEASGSAAAVIQGLKVLGPRGTLVLVGQGAQATLPISQVVTKEIELRGAFRFHEEFGAAADFISKRLIDVRALLSATIAVDDARAAFELAADKSRSMKVQLRF